jgi:hypothetical protein
MEEIVVIPSTKIGQNLIVLGMVARDSFKLSVQTAHQKSETSHDQTYLAPNRGV